MVGFSLAYVLCIGRHSAQTRSDHRGRGYTARRALARCAHRGADARLRGGLPRLAAKLTLARRREQTERVLDII